ncbi:MAG TPA: hypothetical protein VGD37_38240 [Kofleriaceae bacterium]
MNYVRHIGAVGAILIATSIGCGDNGPPTTEAIGQIQIVVAPSPGDVTAIHVAVTSPDFTGSVDTDLVKQPDQSWLGTVLDVPPGAGRTVTAEAFDIDHTNTFEGIATNVTVFAGKLTSVVITLKPTADGMGPGLNTPPHFISLIHPSSILSNQTATLFAAAADPDTNALLTYTWSVLQGGGTVSNEVISNQTPGNAVSTVYTPVTGFTGFALLQVSVTDGVATTTTTLPLAVGAGLVPDIAFDVLPDLTISSVQRQSLMPGGTSDIQFTLTNPVQPWTPTTMHVHTSWSDSCGGTFDAAPEDLDIDRGDHANRTVTYTAPSSQPDGVTRCRLTLTLVDPANVQQTSTIDVWIDPPMVMFVSSVPVAGDSFGGLWEAADAFCQSLADSPTAVVPPGIYHALISFDEISAKDRLVDAPYIRIDGTPIARNKAELFSIDLLNAIRVNEHNSFDGVSAVFTGTNGDGSKGTNCLNWTSHDIDDTSTAGINATLANPNWTNSGTFTCSAQLPIYCVQQPDTNPL